MFDFLRWRKFISERAEALKADGFETKLRLSDQSPKPGTALDVSGSKILGSFANWNTGESDYDIIDVNGQRIGGRWGLLLTDIDFERAFDQFIDELRTAEKP